MENTIHKRKHHVKPVFNDNNAVAGFCKRPERRHQHFRSHSVEIGKRFVENHNSLPHCKGRCGDKSLLLPARKLAALPRLFKLHKLAHRINLLTYLFGRKRKVLTPKRNFVLNSFLYNLFVCVLKHHAHFPADLAEALALYILSVYQHLARKYAVGDVRDNAAHDVQKRAFSLARMSRKKVHFAVAQSSIHMIKYLRFPVVGKAYIFKFYRVHNTTVRTAPAASPARNSTSDRPMISFLYTVYAVFSSEKPRVSTDSDSVSEMFTSRITKGTRKAL